MSKPDTDLLSEEETAQRRDAIVRAMANMPPQPRAAKRPIKARRKATQAASGRKAASAGDAARS